MKTRLFNYITLLAMLLTAIPAKSQNYLKLWFKDGHTERHFMHLVQGINTTKYDLEGKLHADYQMQQIVMPDTTYSYYIADIDSMSFKKVDEEVVYANVIDITNFIRPIFSECKDSASISAYLDEIRNRESVEEVMLTSANLIVTVKDWLPLIYHFPHEQSMFDAESFQSSANFTKQKRQMLLKQNDDVSTAVPNNVYSFAILNQNSKDESRNAAKVFYDIFISDFKAMNISTEYKKCEDLTLDFLRTDIFKYDVVFFMSHGAYDRIRHLTQTGEELGVEGDGSLPWWLDEDDFINIFDAIMKVGKDIGEEAPMKTEEIRNGQKVNVWYMAVSSGHFKDDKKAHLDKAHNTIFLNATCESLKGNGVLERTINGNTQSFKGNSEMAKVFTEKKNYDVYLGYNQKSNTLKDLLFAQYFFEYMLKGYSEEGALNRIYNNRNVSVYDVYSDNDLLDQYNPKYKEDSDGNTIWDENDNAILDEDRKNEWFIANLIDIRADQSAASMFIVKTNTGRKIQEDAEKEYAGSGKITIKGYTSMLDFEDSEIKFGFRYGADSNLDNFKVVYSEGEECTNSEYGNVQFSAKLNPSDLANFEPGQTIYYRAFTFDDVHYNLADEICSFKVPIIPDLALSAQEITLDARTTKTVEIISGSGNYTVSVDPPTYAAASLDGSVITIKGLKEGPAVVTVEDKVSHQTAAINVTVNAPDPTADMKTFTVNGVSFTMVNVEGATYYMGANTNDNNAESLEKPRHLVSLSNYYIGQTEVTQELWTAVMGSNPSKFTDSDQLPVDCVTWNDCQDFVTKLNELTGEKFRLPTEAEWEFAARGGMKTKNYKYSGSDNIDEVAWYKGNAGDAPHPVATKAPNELGLYDMSGNSRELVSDWYGNYQSTAQVNPTGPSTGTNKVERGGSWYHDAKYCRISSRYYSKPTDKFTNVSFRIALSSNNDERFDQIIPEEVLEQIEKHMPIFDGSNPPNIEGEYLVSPWVLAYDVQNQFEVGHVFNDLYLKLYNQDMVNNTLDYIERQSGSDAIGTGSFISGDGTHFTVYFTVEGISRFTNYDINWKEALMISGTKIDSGIGNFFYGFVMLEKSDDPEKKLVDVGHYRVIKDKDGTSPYYNWYSSNAPKRIPAVDWSLPGSNEADPR